MIVCEVFKTRSRDTSAKRVSVWTADHSHLEEAKEFCPFAVLIGSLDDLTVWVNLLELFLD
jgi:hypothetical protein